MNVYNEIVAPEVNQRTTPLYIHMSAMREQPHDRIVCKLGHHPSIYKPGGTGSESARGGRVGIRGHVLRSRSTGGAPLTGMPEISSSQ